jgi:hypothetical protein
VAVIGRLRVLRVLVAEQPVAELDDVAPLLLRHAEDLGEDLHRDLGADLADEVELLLLERASSTRSVTVRTASSHTCTARGVKRRAISPRSSSWRGGSMSIMDLRASIWSGSRSSARCRRSRAVELRVAVHLADVVVAGDGVEAGAVLLGVPVDRVLLAEVLNHS